MADGVTSGELDICDFESLDPANKVLLNLRSDSEVLLQICKPAFRAMILTCLAS